MEKFEYKTVVTNLDEKKISDDNFLDGLNELGEKGWEMVSMVSNIGLGSSKYSLVGITSYALSVFKRKKYI